MLVSTQVQRLYQLLRLCTMRLKSVREVIKPTHPHEIAQLVLINCRTPVTVQREVLIDLLGQWDAEAG
ncbi:hypothetical protein RRG08_061531 [Elysia crispata]|uniref:Uncharacterized protein n=1 Tax=Elysia crispata TaxID=231223 RepID=A0AAE1E3H8_9GAST|nr:hypothetical protein RRG08_061531 [Elysia crispata]